MVYTLNYNVYLIKGYTRGCIYDFNFSRLYSVNNLLADKIDQANWKGIDIDLVDKELEVIFKEFIQLGILIMSESPVMCQINKIKEPDFGIYFAWIEITSKCNLKCCHCYNESDLQCDTVMSLKDYKTVVDSLLRLGVRKVQIIGGEPFFNRQILRDMLDYTVGKFSVIEIFTNGTMITQEWYDYLATNHISVALSVYSYKEEVHDKITRSKGSWVKTNKAIEELRKHNITYRVCNVLMKDTEIGKKTTDLYELSNDKDIVRMSGRANFTLLSDDLIRKKLITKATFCDALKKRFCGTLVSGHNCFKNRVYISSDMTVYPCVMERRLKHCIVNEVSGIVLDESIRCLNKDKINECAVCEYRYVCFDCRPNSLSNDLLEKPWYCTYKPLLGIWENEDEFIKKLHVKWD